MTRARLTLTADDFARASARARAAHMEAPTISIARAVLVDGKRQVDVANETGCTRAWISEAVAKFMKHVEDVQRLTVPKGWKAGTVALPSDLWPAVREMEREARAQLKKAGT